MITITFPNARDQFNYQDMTIDLNRISICIKNEYCSKIFEAGKKTGKGIR